MDVEVGLMWPGGETDLSEQMRKMYVRPGRVIYLDGPPQKEIKSVVRRLAGPWYSLTLERVPYRVGRVALGFAFEYLDLDVSFALLGFFGRVHFFRPRNPAASDPR